MANTSAGRHPAEARIGEHRNVFAVRQLLERRGNLVDLLHACPLGSAADENHHVAVCNLARFDGVRYGYRAKDAGTLSQMYRRSRDEGFGAEVKRRIMLGTYALSAGYYDAYYLKAQKVRTLLTRDFEEAFKKVDAIVTPSTPTPAFKLGEKTDDPLAMYLNDIYTVTADLVGIPGISVPCGKSKSGLPIGLQILGRHFDETTLLRLAHVYEQSAVN